MCVDEVGSEVQDTTVEPSGGEILNLFCCWECYSIHLFIYVVLWMFYVRLGY